MWIKLINQAERFQVKHEGNATTSAYLDLHLLLRKDQTDFINVSEKPENIKKVPLLHLVTALIRRESQTPSVAVSRFTVSL